MPSTNNITVSAKIELYRVPTHYRLAQLLQTYLLHIPAPQMLSFVPKSREIEMYHQSEFEYKRCTLVQPVSANITIIHIIVLQAAAYCTYVVMVV